MNTFRFPLMLCLCALAVTLTGCDVIGSIFKAGAYTGIIAVVLILALLFFIVSKMRNRS